MCLSLGYRRTDVCLKGEEAPQNQQFRHEGLTGGQFLGHGCPDDRRCASVSTSKLIGGSSSTKAAGQNKDDISGFPLGGGTRAVGADKTQPETTGPHPPHPRAANPDNSETYRTLKEIYTLISWTLSKEQVWFFSVLRDFNSWDLWYMWKCSNSP